MRFSPAPCAQEAHPGKGPGGVLWRADALDIRQALLADWEGQAQTIYLDPPFGTGKQFLMRQHVGEEGWRTGKPFIETAAYDDRWPDRDALLRMLREVLTLSHALLRRDGSLFLHIDQRLHPYARLMLDDIFGERNFVNEIIWAYQTGGRSTRHFSRKHDTILFYRKSAKSFFDISAVGVPRGQARSNHMRRGVEKDGRAYRAIVSQGKEYRYYDDDLVFPGDVWSDVAHMQQRDPQRSGYASQKPLRLLERVVLSTTRPGDLVVDLFGGSGTTAVAAAAHGRRFLSVDKGEAALNVARKRLLGHRMRVHAPAGQGAPRLSGRYVAGLGLAEVCLDSYRLEGGLYAADLPDIQAVDQLSLGHLRGDVFHVFDSAARNRLAPALPGRMELPILEGVPAMLTVDILGRRLVHTMEGLDDGE